MSLLYPQNVNDIGDPVFISENKVLDYFIKRWSRSDFLALDTEFIRTNTFYPIPGLIQVSDGKQNYLIDPFEIEDWTAFSELLVNPKILKVLHSCTEDMVVFFSLLKILPTPVFDTQIAAALLGEGFAVGYQNLVKEKIGVELPKDETRSDWLQRPLTNDQLKYAALDVIFLPEIYSQLCRQLKEDHKEQWMEEECERLLKSFDSEVGGDYSSYYLSIGSAWQLSSVQLAVLRSLVCWRETRARIRNRPRNWIIKDKTLVEIAKVCPKNREELQKINEVNAKFVKYEGDVLLRRIQEALSLPVEKLPVTLPKPLNSSQKKKLRECQRYIESKAQELNVSAEILARKKSLIALFYSVLEAKKMQKFDSCEDLLLILPEEFRGWRENIILQDLLKLMD